MREDHSVIVLLLIFVLMVLVPVLYLKKHFYRPKHRVNIQVTLYASETGTLYHLDLEEYLVGVLGAEMPVEFGTEALKAQAVAARTIAVRRLPKFGGRGCRHFPGADFCDDPSENQAWLSMAALQKKWGPNRYGSYIRKVKRAVDDTAGEIMTYQNVPIDAVFHSTCAVGTAAASEVWNYDVPYLQSETCGFDSGSTHFRSYFSFSWKELSRRFKLPETILKKMKIARRSPTGRILWLALGKQFIKGEEFRKIAGLTSACFTWETSRSGVKFTVLGYGHGVGMCQYGANGMAQRGWNYHQILQHYYRGIRFSKICN